MTEDIRRVKTKANIQNALIDLMADDDFEKITIKMLVSRARVNKSTFYRNYSDKYDLFDSILDQLLKEFRAALVPNFFELISIGSVDSIKQTISPIIDFFNRRERTLLILQSCRLSSALFESMVKALHDVLMEGVTTKDFPIKDFYCTLIANNILTTIKWWHLNNHRMNEMSLFKMITNSVNEGIIPSITN